MPVKLEPREERVLKILIKTAKGALNTHRAGLISYKELWERISQKKWWQKRTKEIVRIITRISAFELERGRPPLNELVVKKGSDEPGEKWPSIKQYLNQEFGVAATYSSHLAAQEACWRYWSRKGEKPQTESEAEEGYRQDRTVNFHKRNAQLIAERKQRDNHTCQACGFQLKVNGKFVIDCHHKSPLGLDDNVRITRRDDLVCLCPTCHRVAHTRKYPLTVEEIRSARGISA